MNLTFLGGTGTVTGSKYLVEAAGKRLLVDCGLFQGLKALRLRNWAPLPVEPRSIDAVVLTHAHLDHTGYLPLLIKNGFGGKVYCTEATRDLCGLLLPDSGHLMEEDARSANRHGYSKHAPALPLFTCEDAERALDRFAPITFDRDVPIVDGVSAQLRPAGHILGAATVRLEHRGQSLAFSGDLGRPNDILMKPPAPLGRTDYLLVESTYGDRVHDPVDPQDCLAEIIRRTSARGGVVAVPAFAVARAQALLYRIHLLKKAGAIPSFLPVYLDSPMARDVTHIYCNHREEHRLAPDDCAGMCHAAKMVNSVEESKRLDAWRGPMILLAGSGMVTGGRILHHLKVLAPEARNTILLVGFQAAGTRGAALLAGAREIKIHGQMVPVRAEVAALHDLSAHADAREILDWLRLLEAPPATIFVTHGEPAAAEALRSRISSELGWSARVPEYLERVELGT